MERGFSLRFGDNSERIQPSIFMAAECDDVVELQMALRDGQSLNDTSGWGGNTPMHIACRNNSINFIRYAATTGDADPWIRDHNHYLAIDHAAARSHKDIQRILLSLMYPPGWDRTGSVEPFPAHD